DSLPRQMRVGRQRGGMFLPLARVLIDPHPLGVMEMGAGEEFDVGGALAGPAGPGGGFERGGVILEFEQERPELGTRLDRHGEMNQQSDRSLAAGEVGALAGGNAMG